jgi:hypothetical protein
MESIESQKPAPTLSKSLRDYHNPTASTAGIFQSARARETESKNPRPLDLKGVGMEVLGPKCNERLSTLAPLRAFAGDFVFQLRDGVAGRNEVVAKLSSGDAGRTQVLSMTLSEFGIARSVAQLYQA